MDRRDFIKKSAVAAAGSLLLATPFASMLASNEDKKGKGMKIVVLTGSPRKNGNTNHMADQFIKGAKEAGHDVFRFNCATSEVHPCLGCNHCGMDGPCVYDDDFTNILRPECK